MLKISDELASYVTELFPEEKAENKIKRLIENELRRRLARYQLTIRNLEAKYRMDFETFKAEKMVAKKGYSFEVENDFCDWEMALDGLKTIRRKLNKLQESNNEN
ncbi:MAG: hypothetical protein ONB31_04155 [candidate division KSB1 bacterium]|nr:hypothetical protein [candidate division KSB1 bacterium]MDZ7336721.1 hypothetical protein [candidate division KSB1 bacterium]MDZ7356714.1 hypothetical protein [candidate division KSB1 bacterium]MDZ7398624.1 hypothetical protein [candidate division KSB1 bacterium]